MCRLQCLCTLYNKIEEKKQFKSKTKKKKIQTASSKKIILALQHSCTCGNVQLFIFLCKFIAGQAPSDQVQLFYKPPYFLVLYSVMLSAEHNVVPDLLYLVVSFCYSIVSWVPALAPVFCCVVVFRLFYHCFVVPPVFCILPMFCCSVGVMCSIVPCS